MGPTPLCCSHPGVGMTGLSALRVLSPHPHVLLDLDILLIEPSAGTLCEDRCLTKAVNLLRTRRDGPGYSSSLEGAQQTVLRSSLCS